MESRKDRQNKIIIPGKKITDDGEVERILRQYAGIFPKNIQEFAEKIAAKTKVQKNYSR